MYKSYSNKHENSIVTIYAGEYYVTDSNEIISTVLGSCVAVCLYDSINKVSGMNHFMLPNISFNEENMTNSENRYGQPAIETLLNELIKLGADKNRIKAKIFGGGNVLKHNSNKATIGEANVEFAKLYLKNLGIEIEKEDVGSNTGRNITFVTKTNTVFVKKIKIGDVVLQN